MSSVRGWIARFCSPNPVIFPWSGPKQRQDQACVSVAGVPCSFSGWSFK
jgi:hypothetical protein